MTDEIEFKMHIRQDIVLNIPKEFVEATADLLKTFDFEYQYTLTNDGNGMAEIWAKYISGGDDSGLVEILLPLRRDFPDFRRRFNELIQNLAKAIKGDEFSIASMLRINFKQYEMGGEK